MLELRAIVILGAAVAASLFAFSASRAQVNESGDLSIELIDRKVLRVCADPRNMPFSNEKGEGFENKIADLFARKLGKSVGYAFYPQAPGFVRNTLGAYKCDVIMGYPQGNDIVQSTNPYYHTAYALVSRPGTGFDDIETLADLRLRGKRIGIVAGTPPATLLAVNGLMATAKPYPLVIDTRFDSSAQAMMKDLASGEIELAVLWGPMAGYYAMKADPPMKVVPLTKERSGPRLAYYITMGVRGADQEWKRELNRLIAENQPEINAILTSFGVPLLPIGEAPASRQ